MRSKRRGRAFGNVNEPVAAVCAQRVRWCGGAHGNHIVDCAAPRSTGPRTMLRGERFEMPSGVVWYPCDRTHRTANINTPHLCTLTHRHTHTAHVDTSRLTAV
eukprot:7142263-Prymnesium_polylepis.1